MLIKFLVTILTNKIHFVYLPIFVKSKQSKLKTIGTILRELRETKGLLLREVGAELSLDPTILSKIERGQRNASREQVIKLAEFFNIKENDLLVSWLSDKLVYEVSDEDVALKALQVAEEKVKYQKKNKK